MLPRDANARAFAIGEIATGSVAVPDESAKGTAGRKGGQKARKRHGLLVPGPLVCPTNWPECGSTNRTKLSRHAAAGAIRAG